MAGRDTRIELSALNPGVCLTDIQVMLTKAFEQRDISQFRQALALGADPLVRDSRGNFSLFELICKAPGTAAFLEACIKSGIADTPNPISGKRAINFLAESLDPANLEMFLGYFPNTDVNTTDEDDSPIHVIVKSLTEENFSKCYDCVKILVKHGANVNIPDAREFTPILTLARSRVLGQEEIIKYLLKHCKVELDEFRDGEARLLIQTKFPHINLSTKTEVEKNFDYFAKHLMDLHFNDAADRKGQEERFLSELKQFLGAKSDEEIRKFLTDTNSNGTLLGMAIRVGSKETVKEILKNGADPNGSKGSRRPIAIACIHGQWAILEVLLESEGIDANFPDDPPLCLIVKKLGEPSNTSNCDYQKCFDVLVEHPKIDVNQRDKCGSTALHYAVRYKEEKAIRALLDKNTYLGTRNVFQDLPITEMNPNLLEEYFDSRITTNGRRAGDEDLEIYFDYSCLVPPDVCETAEKFSEEMNPIYEMTKSRELRSLVKHPLISSFLFLKWHRLGAIFYGNLILYSISTLTIILYILLCYGRDVSDEMRFFMLTISSLGVLFIIGREASQFITAPVQYFRQVENYLEMAIIGISIVVLTGYSVTEHTRRVIAAILILLSAVEFSLLVGSLPHLSISTHMVMLKTVSVTFIRSLMLYSILLIAFAFCFYTLLGGVSDSPGDNKVEDEFNKFMDPGTAIIKTIVMMTGEFEAANIEFKSNTLSYIFFLLFVFFMSVVLFNLLNGLAVSDTQAIKAEAELTGFISRAEVLTRYEKLVFGHNPGTWFRMISDLCYFRKIAKKFISIFPFYLPENILVLNPNRSNRIYNHSSTSKRLRSESVSLENDSLLNTSTSCCFGCDKCTSLDGKIVRFTKQVLERKHWTDQSKQDKLRLENIERQLGEINQKIEILLQNQV
ncbi:transient receptor potential cation channel protein painless [Phlebotomus argentipes]|uniref:transient receptor potential cation channel protein painless n=1 Tax=Phlebotomus argentipes TaxID=94469 RepID=UPI00289339D3|nr:transient receptor potential cation channel protein painless [Phlebotomus argentipes]XP_059621001.1 transient receptor potential cation channel protein painless [Phlebotomus argentipes]